MCLKRKTRKELEADLQKAVELLDGAYDIVEIHPARSTYLKEWKARWMEEARKLGAHPSW